MYKTTNEFISLTKQLQEAMLLCLALDVPMHVVTLDPGVIPMIPSFDYRKVLNANLVIEAVEVGTPVQEPKRFLTLINDGGPVPIGTNADTVKSQAELMATEKFFVFLQLGMSESPYPTPPEALVDRCAISVHVGLLPDDAVRMINFVGAHPVFSAANIASLREKTKALVEGGGDAFLVRVAKAIRGTRPDSVESAQARTAGINTNNFGYGLSERAGYHLFGLCAAKSVLDGRGYINEQELVNLFVPATAHRIIWGAAKPLAGFTSNLTKVAEWALGV